VKIKTYESDHHNEDPWLKNLFTLEVLINVFKITQKLLLTSENEIFPKSSRKGKDIFAKNKNEIFAKILRKCENENFCPNPICA